MKAYYNEKDQYAAQWLRNLIAAGHIAPGEVDERSIEDVRPVELAGYSQCHFFAGIGVWSRALRLAGWPDGRPVWTGSCPCQPFSPAGQRAGFTDERHLWPAWFHLISECHPSILFGEQVAGKDADHWLDLVHDDMESLGYAFGAIPFPAAGIDAPHIRDRLYWVADANGRDAGAERKQRGREQRQQSQDGGASGLANPNRRTGDQRGSDVRGRTSGGNAQPWAGPSGSSVFGGRPGAADSFWRDADWLLCTDERWRPVEPGTFPLAHGATARVGRLRAYGNAIVAPQASEWVKAYMNTQAIKEIA